MSPTASNGECCHSIPCSTDHVDDVLDAGLDKCLHGAVAGVLATSTSPLVPADLALGAGGGEGASDDEEGEEGGEGERDEEDAAERAFEK